MVPGWDSGAWGATQKEAVTTATVGHEPGANTGALQRPPHPDREYVYYSSVADLFSAVCTS